jgi:hypothetical protein
MRMPRFQEMRPTSGAYVAFYCESCSASVNSSPDVGGAIGNEIKNALFRQIPLVGAFMGGTSQTIDRDAHWRQVESQFVECAACKKVVCRGCYDASQQKCRSCNAGQMAAAAGGVAANAAAAVGMGLGAMAGALGNLGAAAGLAMIECPSCRKQTLRAPNCQQCGQKIPENLIRGSRCSKCGSGMMPGAKFCAKCGGAAA